MTGAAGCMFIGAVQPWVHYLEQKSKSLRLQSVSFAVQARQSGPALPQDGVLCAGPPRCQWWLHGALADCYAPPNSALAETRGQFLVETA